MSTVLRPTAFALLGVQLLNVGPLTGLSGMDFTDAEGRPANLYLIMGPNGSGKTTILEAVYYAMRLLDARAHEAFGLDALDQSRGSVQLDARVVLDDGVRARPFVLSIVAGPDGVLRAWSPEELSKAEADEQIVLTYERRSPAEPVTRSADSHPTALAFAEAILELQGEAPRDLFESALGYPTVLYFPSNRGIAPPPSSAAIARPQGLGYHAAHKFHTDGATWAESLDNLFVWFTWLADGRAERVRELVNDLVFRGGKRLGEVDRERLFVPVEVEGARPHRLHQLSSGERQLVQLIVRVASHMTGATIVLIDETEQHLHTTMRRRLINILKEWAADFSPGLSFIMTSHELQTYRQLAPQMPEPKLFKNAAIVKPRFGRSRS